MKLQIYNFSIRLVKFLDIARLNNDVFNKIIIYLFDLYMNITFEKIDNRLKCNNVIFCDVRMRANPLSSNIK